MFDHAHPFAIAIISSGFFTAPNPTPDDETAKRSGDASLGNCNCIVQMAIIDLEAAGF